MNSAYGPFAKKKKEYKNLKKQEIHNKIIRYVVILKICQEEQLLIKYYMRKHLILLKIQSMVDIKEVLVTRTDKSAVDGAIQSRIILNKELVEELHKL